MLTLRLLKKQSNATEKFENAQKSQRKPKETQKARVYMKFHVRDNCSSLSKFVIIK